MIGAQTRGWSARLAHRIGSLTRRTGVASRRFPEATLLIVAVAAVSNLEIAETDWFAVRDLPRLLTVLAGAAAVSVAVKLVLEAWDKRSVVWSIMPAAAAALFALLLWNGEPLALYAGATLPAATTAIVIAPFIGRGTGRQFWIFGLWTAVGVVLAFLAVLLFVAGFLAILEMVRFLFRIRGGQVAYGHILVTGLTLVGPLLALGTIPSPVAEAGLAEPDTRLMRANEVVLRWIAVPLALLTAVVLHLYAGRILVTGEIPVGEIGWIVSFVAGLFVLLRIGIEPFWRPEEGGILRLFARSWWLLLLVPLGLLAVAVSLRVGAEGVTVARYYLALGGVSTAIVVLLQLLPGTRGDIRSLAAVPVVLLALSVAGPFGAAAVVGRSQVEKIAAENGSLVDGGGSALSDGQRRRLRSRIEAIGDVGQLGRVAQLLPPADVARLFEAGAASEGATRIVVDALGLGRVPPSTPVDFYAATTTAPLAVGGFDLAFIGRDIGRSTGRAARDRTGLAVTFQATALVLVAGGVTDTVLLDATLAQLRSDAGGVPPTADLVTTGGRNLRLQIESLHFPAGRPASGRLTLLLREAEWPAGSLRGD